MISGGIEVVNIWRYNDHIKFITLDYQKQSSRGVPQKLLVEYIR